jgi:hypothetical protein
LGAFEALATPYALMSKAASYNSRRFLYQPEALGEANSNNNKEHQ